MKKKVTITLVLLVSVLIGVLVSTNFKKEESSFKEKESTSSTLEQIVGENTLSMMLETAYQSGNYKMTTQSSWPSDGYVFNPTLSKCENGGELSWNDEKKLVSMTGNMSDKCYVYFDKLTDPTLADYCTNGNVLSSCITAFASSESADTTNIYYHNGTITSDDGTILDAQDNSYRYAGASASVNNYLCIGSNESPCPDDNLFRIIGVFDGKVKLIRAKSIGRMYWDTGDSNTWSTSSLYKYLNGLDTNAGSGYIDSISSFSSKIDTAIWKVGGDITSKITGATPASAYQYEMTSKNVGTDNKHEISAQIGLMYVSDYEFVASPSAWTLVGNNDDSTKDYRAATSINWLYLGSNEWLVSRSSSYSKYVFLVYSDGRVIYFYVGSVGSYAVRPVFYLDSSVTYSSGSGSASDPIRVV